MKRLRTPAYPKTQLNIVFLVREISLKELMEQQIAYFEKFTQAYLAILQPDERQPTLRTQIATLRLAIDQPRDVTTALALAQMSNPKMLDRVRQIDAVNVQRIKDEATDPEFALLHWEAARGMAFAALLGLCPLSEEWRDRLFDRLWDETRKFLEDAHVHDESHLDTDMTFSVKYDRFPWVFP